MRIGKSILHNFIKIFLIFNEKQIDRKIIMRFKKYTGSIDQDMTICEYFIPVLVTKQVTKT